MPQYPTSDQRQGEAEVRLISCHIARISNASPSAHSFSHSFSSPRLHLAERVWGKWDSPMQSVARCSAGIAIRKLQERYDWVASEDTQGGLLG